MKGPAVRVCYPKPETPDPDLRPTEGKEADEELASLAKALGHPARVQILRILSRRTTCVCGDIVDELDFAGGTVRSLSTSNRFVNRITPGIAYRPVPPVVFQLAYEFTWTNSGESLAGVTNYLPAQEHEDTNRAVLLGVAFGF